MTSRPSRDPSLSRPSRRFVQRPFDVSTSSDLACSHSLLFTNSLRSERTPRRPSRRSSRTGAFYASFASCPFVRHIKLTHSPSSAPPSPPPLPSQILFGKEQVVLPGSPCVHYPFYIHVSFLARSPTCGTDPFVFVLRLASQDSKWFSTVWGRGGGGGGGFHDAKDTTGFSRTSSTAG